MSSALRIVPFAAVLALVAVTFVPTARADSKDLTLGEFRLAKPADKAIIDGDTIRVEGLDSSLRLLGIDTEETFKKEANRTAANTNFRKYVTEMVASSTKPIKFGTPMGEEAKKFAQRFFSGRDTVRLDIDEKGRDKGYYGRYLVYVMIKKGGKWVNYNVECVRAGMSPYFTKYGRSARFHDEFVAAEKEARAAKRGIWKPGAKGYPDYAARLKWWGEREKAVAHFKELYEGKEGYYQLGLEEDWDKLLAAKGKKVIVFGTVGDIDLEHSPSRAFLGHRKNMDFAIISFDKERLAALHLEKFDGQYIYVEGEASEYKGRPQFRADRGQLRIWTE
jgi:endonuclease YncB( thermonuclease family)